MSLAGGKEPIESTKKTSGKGESSSPQSEIRDLANREQTLKSEAEKKSKDPQVIHQIAIQLPKLIQKTHQIIEASQVFQTFKLPGTDYVVHDRREGAPTKDKTKTIADESKMPLEALLVQKGKLTPTKEKDYENYFADPTKKGKVPEQKVAEDRLMKLLTRFEQALLKRFEGGAKLTQELEKEHPSFFKKTADQWREFFGKFMKRTVKRHASLEQVSEWIYRGFVQKNAKSTVISDLAFANGQLEKFVRFRLPGGAQNLANRLANLEPGVRLSAEELRDHLKEDFDYLAIKQSEGEAAWAMAPTNGKFLGSAKSEEGHSEEGQTQFIPWYQVPLSKSVGKRRAFRLLPYLIVILLLAIGFIYL